MLLILKGDSTDEFEPMLAESWEVSEDQSTYTFKLYPDVMFQDGTPANAQAVKDSYTRWIELEGSPVNVITRFCDSPDKMEVVDETTLRFNLGSPQPLFLAAMASSYGPMVISPTALAENATEDDPYAHEWAKAFAVGSGPYILESNSVSEGIILSAGSMATTGVGKGTTSTRSFSASCRRTPRGASSWSAARPTRRRAT